MRMAFAFDRTVRTPECREGSEAFGARLLFGRGCKHPGGCFADNVFQNVPNDRLMLSKFWLELDGGRKALGFGL